MTDVIHSIRNDFALTIAREVVIVGGNVAISPGMAIAAEIPEQLFLFRFDAEHWKPPKQIFASQFRNQFKLRVSIYRVTQSN